MKKHFLVINYISPGPAWWHYGLTLLPVLYLLCPSLPSFSGCQVFNILCSLNQLRSNLSHFKITDMWTGVMPTVHISLRPHAAEKLRGKKLSARNNSQNRFLAALVEQTFGVGLTQMKLHCELPQLGLKSVHFSQVPSAFPGRLSRVL